MIENGTLLQDRYLIEKQIGAGGMGAVYLAVDQRFGSYVAIKETFYKDEEFGDAFEREARLLNTLHHPVLPHVSDYFTENSEHFLVMQYIEGEDLSVTLKREGAFPVRDVLRWMDGLLDALDYLHSQEPPIIHRDIKPQNLKITPRGDIILLDFGLAKLKSEDTTNAKSVFGYSRKYSPLEQIQGTGTDSRSDIFSLGATAFHLLTGTPAVDVLARATEIVVGNPDPLELASEINSDVPIDIARVLHSALALNPAARFVSAKAMRQALEHAINTGFPEVAEAQPEEKIASVVPLETPVVHSPEAEKFPALEAFVAETVKTEPETIKEEEAGIIETPKIVVETPVEEPTEIEHQSNSIVEVPTKVVAASVAGGSHTKKIRFPIAALIALLLCVGLSVGYFIRKAKTSGDENQTPVVQTTPEQSSTGELNMTVPDSQPIEDQVTTEPKTVEQAKTKPVSIERTTHRVDKKESNEIPEVEVEPVIKPEAVQREVKRPPLTSSATTTVSKKSESPRRNTPPQPRVVEPQQPIGDIESIFTGQSDPVNEKARRREERRKEREGMTEDELRELQRERRQRRQRPRGSTFPF